MDFSIANNHIDYRRQDRRRSYAAIQNDNRIGVERRNRNVFDKLQNDIDKLDSKTVKTVLTVLSPVPTLRRVNSVPDALEEKNYSRVAGLIGLAAANLPRDIEELGRAMKNGLAKNPYQHEFSFFKGTCLEILPEKFKCLKNLDKSLFNTKSGEFLQKTCKIGVDFSDMGTVKSFGSNSEISGYKYTGNLAQKTAGKALHRIPAIGVYLAALFEIPALVKSVKTEGTVLDKAKAFGKQLIKSAGYIGLTTAGIALGGALLFPQGAVLGLIGMGIGSAIALTASKEINKNIDKWD